MILETGTDSFPSGHTSFVFSIVWALVIVLVKPGPNRRVAIVTGAILVVVVGTSRLYLGVHYPSDVIGSVVISTAAIVLWLPVWNRLVEPVLLRSALISKLSTAQPIR